MKPKLLACVLGALGPWIGGCNGDARGATAQISPEPVAVESPASLAHPATKAQFLALIAPLPSDALLVVYRVQGPAGISGSLELLAKPGGYRRENWTLELRSDPEADAIVARGSTIQTPTRMWTGGETDPGIITDSSLGQLAAGYILLGTAEQHKVVASIRRWRADLEAARQQHPGETRQIAGVACLDIRIAAQDVCVWEETGIPLHYQSPDVVVQAVRIESDPELAGSAFELPSSAAAAAEAAVPTELDFDPDESLRQLQDGQVAPLALLLQPGFRVPI